MQALRVSPVTFENLVAQERQELDRRVRRYRGERSLPPIHDRHVVLVDDGLATGVTAEVALRALRDGRPRQLLLAVPAGAADTAERLGALADVVCVHRPVEFHAVGRWYERFDQTSDAEVLELLVPAREWDVMVRPGRDPVSHRLPGG